MNQGAAQMDKQQKSLRLNRLVINDEPGNLCKHRDLAFTLAQYPDLFYTRR
jgi:hypothetical protein